MQILIEYHKRSIRIKKILGRRKGVLLLGEMNFIGRQNASSADRIYESEIRRAIVRIILYRVSLENSYAYNISYIKKYLRFYIVFKGNQKTHKAED